MDRDELIKLRAERIAARVSLNVGFDPLTIITILTSLLPLIAQCFNRNDEPDQTKIAATLRRQNESAPFALRRRLARRIRGEAEQPMSKTASFELAYAIIEDTLEEDDVTVEAFVCAMNAE